MMARSGKQRGGKPRGRSQGQASASAQPLPADSGRLIKQYRKQSDNPGLLLDRYIPWRRRQTREGKDEWSLGGQDKYRWLETVASSARQLDALLQENHARWQQIVQDAGAVKGITRFTATTDWRMVVGLGGGHVLETAMTLHRIYGFPIIPGSALKGMTRAWVELEVKPDDDLVVAVFGTPPGETPMKAGQVIFFDAVPTQVPKLELDVMNPHYGDYYAEKKDRGRPIPPADYLSPVPVYFLTVAGGCEFAFAVAPRNGNKGLAETAAGWLKEALREMGVGAKTVAGYGYFR
jgi:CRISPR-associated protein Cmr6